MRDTSLWTRLKQGIAGDLRRVRPRLGPAGSRMRESWPSHSLPYKLLFVVVGMGFLRLVARRPFRWEALSIAAFSQAPWYKGAIGIGFVLIVSLPVMEAAQTESYAPRSRAKRAI